MLLSPRLRKDRKVKAGMQVYAWFLWEKKYKGPATLEWLDNNPHILRTK